jgi:hypothetical protein
MPVKITEDLYEYEVGDAAWIYVGASDAVEGTVIAVVNLVPQGRQYVIAIPTASDEFLEIRDGYKLHMQPTNPKIKVIADLINNYISKRNFSPWSEGHLMAVATLILEEL